MPFDGLVLNAVCRELEEKLLGGRIERIYQPGKMELVMLVHKPGARQRLFLSADARNARAHLTTTSRENPTAPPLFCMVLRKHLEGGRIAGFAQPGLERVLVIKIDSRDELGQPAEKHLVCEIMGKHSNIILFEPSTNTIIDGIKRYSHAVSRFREVLPGRPYLSPPTQGKLDPLKLNEDRFRLACLDSPLDTPLPNLLQKRFEGLSTVTCREIIYRTGLAPETMLNHCGDYELRLIWQEFSKIISQAGTGLLKPCLVSGRKGEPVDFAAVELSHMGQYRKHGEINFLLDLHFAAQESLERLSRQRNSLATLLNKEIARVEKKLDLYAFSIDDTAGLEKLGLYGELLTANLYRLKQGLVEATLENYHEEQNPPVTIPLDPQRTPVENAQAYFKKYQKAKNTRLALHSLNAQALEELEYLDGIKTALDQAADLSELAEIKQELLDQKYLKQPSPGPRTPKTKKEKHVPKPFAFQSTDGFRLLVGKNNKQNDYLTMKMARENDIWLHAKDIPGAHVIIRVEGKEPPPATLAEAAGLAAFFSKARNSKTVPVDYTLKKHVHKPNGARPGLVIYERQKTIMASPDEELTDRLSSTQPNE
ncbi:MAG: NFACT RNA binding domain-containing protein [Desulfotomaculaceae bacterium]